MRTDISLHRRPPWSMFTGLGLRSVYAKALRDSRLAFLVIVGLAGLILLAGAQTMATTYGTPLARTQMADYVAQIPAALRGFYGTPLHVDTLGGFLSWHYSGMLTLLIGLWPILALSRTLASDLRCGSLEFVAAAPISRRRIAIEQVAGHVTAFAAAMAGLALAAWLAGQLAAKLPGDEIAPSAAIGFAAGIGANSLLFGALAFAISPFAGSRTAAVFAGMWMLGGFLIHGYRSAVPAFGAISPFTSFTWLEGNLPLAGAADWGASLVVAVCALMLLGVGIEAFVRRDMLAVTSSRLPGLPAVTHGLRGPMSRSFGDQLPAALGWGIAIGFLGFLMAAASKSFAEEIHKVPDILRLVQQLFPSVNITTPGGFLQFVFIDFGLILAGLAAATLVAGLSSDETSGRAEMLLATPISRARSELAAGLAGYVAMGLVAVLAGACIAAGAAAVGGDAITPGIGTLAVALYGAALAGVGLAVGGFGRAAWAAPAVVVAALGTFLLDFLAEPLRLPDWLHQLALSSHLGQPMAGYWDTAGVMACLVLAAGGLLLGIAGMRLRDIAR